MAAQTPEINRIEVELGKNLDGNYRIEYSEDNGTTWKPLPSPDNGNFALQSGSVLTSADVSSSSMNWSNAMGIGQEYLFTTFFTSYQTGTGTGDHDNINYSTTTSTGCAGYSETGYPAGSWRLPTKAEWIEINNNFETVGNLRKERYWSGTENNSTTQTYSSAYTFDFSTQSTVFSSKQNRALVRCVRD